MTAELRSTTTDQTLVLTISNPGLRNALGPELYAAGIEALNAAENNPEVRSVILTGDQGVFSAGGNLQRLRENRNLPPERQAHSIDQLHGWIEAIRAFPKPVIAAVEGAAAGAGFSLALACDFIVAASDAVFVMAYSTVGLSPDGGATWHLARAVPRGLAATWLMLAERVAPAELHRLGVVHSVTTPGAALDGALALSRRLNARAPNALASIKELLNDAPLAPLDAQLDAEREHFVRNLFHPNAGIGIQAFLDRTTPKYDDQA